ncbi:MAG: hypothetical protein QXP47_05520, partial [Candidatus Nezhaarchaeales archaeon]
MLFDTNLLMAAFERPVDVIRRVEELLEAKIEPIILKAQLQELEKIALSEKRWKASRMARAVLDYVRFKFKVIEGCGESVDDAIVEAAKREGCIVA